MAKKSDNKICAFYLILLFYIARCTFAICPGEFQKRCSCGPGTYEGIKREVIITNCTNANFTDVSILAEIPPDTQVLIVTGSNFPDIPKNLFGTITNYKQLQVLDLSNNDIRNIHGGAFHRIPAVQKLILDNNNWTIDDIHQNLFSNLPALKELRLSNAFAIRNASKTVGNVLKIIQSNKATMNHLQTLDLSKNHLAKIDTTPVCDSKITKLNLSANRLKNFSGSCLPDLKVLDLSYNFLPYLSDISMQLFDNLPSIKINLDSNHFVCNCRMANTLQWLRESPDNTVERKYELTCFDGYPYSNIGQYLVELFPSDLQCWKSAAVDPANGAYIAMGIVIVLMILVIILFLVKNRDIVVNASRKLMQPLSSRINYQTLNETKQEMAAEVQV